MPGKYEAILFDLDGTLVDTEQHIFQAFNYALAKEGLSELALSKMHSLAGVPLKETYRILGGKTEKQLLELCALHNKFQKENMQLVTPYSDSIETVQEISSKGFKIGVITSRGRATTTDVIRIGGFSELIDAVVDFEDAPKPKPAPDPFLLGASRLGIMPGKCLAVGDACVDVISGKSAGMDFALASYGYGSLTECHAKPDFRLKKLSEIMQLL